MRGAAMRRALCAAVATVLLSSAFAACGGGGEPTIAVPDRDADVKVLDGILGRQLGAVAGYGEVLPRLRGASAALGREFRAQEQEHVDATIKTLRGLQAEDDVEPEAIDLGEPKTRADALRTLYEMESATIDAELNAITKLSGGWPRALLATMVANQAQRLVLIRRALGLKPLESIPSAFEDGTTPAP
jgi:hypothetical protein